MTNSLSTYRRRAGVAFLAGAALNVSGCIVAVVSSADSHVPSDLARAPMTHNAAIAVYVLAAIAEVLFVGGLVCLRRSGLPSSRSVAIGLSAAVAGTALIAVCNAASLAVADQLNNSTAASWVWAGFGVGSILVAAGMIAAGLAISRHAVAPTWRDRGVLIAGLLSLPLLALGPANVVWVGIVIYALGYAGLGVALLTAGGQRRQAVVQPA